MIIALAGRRIGQAGDSNALFPDANTQRVRERLKSLFQEVGATALVASGACGADLLAMEVAKGLGLKRRMVLPFERDRFLASSVTDRAYARDWGAVFRNVTDEIGTEHGLIVLDDAGEGDAAYRAVNGKILDEAQRLAREGHTQAIAVVVWDGKPREGGDLTEAFANQAGTRSLSVKEVLTTDKSRGS